MVGEPHIITRVTGQSLASAGTNNHELEMSEYVRAIHVYFQVLTAASLVGGRVFLEEFDPVTGTWGTAFQWVTQYVSASGTPQVEQAGATVSLGVAAGLSSAMTGIKNLTDTGIMALFKLGNGKRTRLSLTDTSGTATYQYGYTGARLLQI